ncbi:MAG: hypothetical protein WAU65_00835 [Candidatus Nanoarchaeia archaeon]
MAKKRGKRVSSSRARVSRSRSSRRSSRVPLKRPSNVRVVLANLVIFIALFLVSLILYQLFFGGIISDPSGVFLNLFGIFMVAFGFISVAFFITLLVFLFMNFFKRKR